MPDILVRHIDEAVAERIKELARARHWSLNDVILHALRHGLGMAGSEPTGARVLPPGGASALLDDAEDDAMRAAVAALCEVPDGRFARDQDAG